MLLRHVGIVFFLLETHLNRDAASVQESLAVEEPYGKEGALLVFVIHERPKLSLLQSNRLNFSEQRENLIQSLPAGLSR